MAAPAIIGTKYMIDLEYIVLLLESKALALGFFLNVGASVGWVERKRNPPFLDSEGFNVVELRFARPIRRLRLLNYWH